MARLDKRSIRLAAAAVVIVAMLVARLGGIDQTCRQPPGQVGPGVIRTHDQGGAVEAALAHGHDRLGHLFMSSVGGVLPP